jgi:NAD(P)-dependent dehydrogenase (short-subunit alcohol dehydrogenase family)
MELDFAGKKLIVIGGTSGIGKAVASLVLSNGGSALLVGRREAKTREAILELRSRGEVSGWTVDITSGAGRANLIDHLNAKHTDATLLVNAAGVFAPKPFLEHTEPDYDRFLENQQGPLLHHAMRGQEHGGR